LGLALPLALAFVLPNVNALLPLPNIADTDGAGALAPDNGAPKVKPENTGGGAPLLALLLLLVVLVVLLLVLAIGPLPNTLGLVTAETPNVKPDPPAGLLLDDVGATAIPLALFPDVDL
jgi:hypothetical protein